MLDPQAFFAKMLPWAQMVREQTGVPVSVTLAQWGNESGYESNTWIGHNNYSGITDGRGGFLSFGSITEFVSRHIATLKEPYYTDVLHTASSGGNPYSVAEALGRSPWDAGHYRDAEMGLAGSSLATLIQSYGLTKYDTVTNGGKPPGWDTIPAPDSSQQSMWEQIKDPAFWKHVGIIILIGVIGLMLLTLGTYTLTKSIPEGG